MIVNDISHNWDYHRAGPETRPKGRSKSWSLTTNPTNIMNSSIKDSEVDANASPPQGSTPKTTPKKTNRRGRGSREKAAEKFRKHKNETVGAAMIADRINKFHLEHGIDQSELFGEMVSSIPVVKPEQPVSVSTHKLAEVAEKTVHTLVNACKVPSQDVAFDVTTVQLAASLQLDAKVFLARQKSSAPIVDGEREVRVERVVRNLSTGILPIAVFLDQVGLAECDSQKFYPVTNEANGDGVIYSFSHSDFHEPDLFHHDIYPVLLGGWRTADNELVDVNNCIDLHARGFRGGEMFLRLTDAAAAVEAGVVTPEGQLAVPVNALPPVLPPWGEYLELVFRNNMPPLDDIFARYLEFISGLN